MIDVYFLEFFICSNSFCLSVCLSLSLSLSVCLSLSLSVSLSVSLSLSLSLCLHTFFLSHLFHEKCLILRITRIFLGHVLCLIDTLLPNTSTKLGWWKTSNQLTQQKPAPCENKNRKNEIRISKEKTCEKLNLSLQTLFAELKAKHIEWAGYFKYKSK